MLVAILPFCEKSIIPVYSECSCVYCCSQMLVFLHKEGLKKGKLKETRLYLDSRRTRNKKTLVALPDTMTTNDCSSSLDAPRKLLKAS